jgi:LmbE family N-acetylglucosaminyl deacetylase
MRSGHNPELVPEPTPGARLIIAPHADDETLGCGGLIAKYADECVVTVLARPDDAREQEFSAAQAVLGYKRSYLLDLRDGYIGADMHELVRLLDEVIALCQPSRLYLPYPSMHQDHVAAYEAGIRASRLSMTAGHWFTPSVFVYDVAAYDVTLYPTDLKWNVFESLTEGEIDRKTEAIAAYASQAMPGPHPANDIKQAAHALGSARRVAWAEQFCLVRDVKS